MGELKRTLVEDIYYPPHEPRRASAEFRHVRHKLIVEMDEPCWICGIRNSTGGKMEAHHDQLEWAAANGVDLGLVTRDFPEIMADPQRLRDWLDSEGNMLVLCADHHRGSRKGIHCLTYPAWKLQRWQGKEWTFIKA